MNTTTQTPNLFGSVEAGGTKFVCAVGSGPEDLREEIRFPTTTPEETLGRMLEFFKKAEKLYGRIEAFGIASFGPVDLDEGSPTYGFITSTPKKGWRNTDLVGAIRRDFRVPLGFDTDVNGAALGERKWGAAKGLDNVVYFTIGTGIGGGVLVSGAPVHGLVHPELGHLRIPRNPAQDPFRGNCPFHGDCLEGLAAGPAIKARWGRGGEELLDRKEVWDLEAEYLACGVVNAVVAYSPERVILGGGVMDNLFLFPLIRKRVLELLGNYVQAKAILEGIDEYVVPPGLGNKAGLAGGFVLAERALAKKGGS